MFCHLSKSPVCFILEGRMEILEMEAFETVYKTMVHRRRRCGITALYPHKKNDLLFFPRMTSAYVKFFKHILVHNFWLFMGVSRYVKFIGLGSSENFLKRPWMLVSDCVTLLRMLIPKGTPVRAQNELSLCWYN